MGNLLLAPRWCPLVQEFYAHINSPDNPFIYVKGKLVPLDEDNINAQLVLVVFQDEHTSFTENITVEGLNQVLKDLCVKGIRWIISSQDCHTIERITLNPIEKVWYHYLKSRIMPSTHNAAVLKEWILLLHSIIMSRKSMLEEWFFMKCTDA